MAEGKRKTLGYAQYSPSAAVRKFSDNPTVGSPAPPNAYGCKIQVEAQAIRWRDDGGDPTATVGMIMTVSSGTGQTDPIGPSSYYEGDLDKFRWIEVSAGAIVNVSYYGL